MSNKTVKSRVLSEDSKIINTIVLAVSIKLNRQVKTAEVINALIGVVLNGHRHANKNDIARIANFIEKRTISNNKGVQ